MLMMKAYQTLFIVALSLANLPALAHSRPALSTSSHLATHSVQAGGLALVALVLVYIWRRGTK